MRSTVGNASGLKQISLAVQDMSSAAYLGKRQPPRMKNMFGRCGLRAQVRHQRIPYIAGQWQHALAVALRAADCQGPVSPVNVAGSEVGDFSEPHSKPKKQQQ